MRGRARLFALGVLAGSTAVLLLAWLLAGEVIPRRGVSLANAAALESAPAPARELALAGTEPGLRASVESKAPAPTPAPATRELLVRVVAEDGPPIPQAAVFQRKVGEDRPLGETDSRGELRAGIEEGAVEVLASHPEFATAGTAFYRDSPRSQGAGALFERGTGGALVTVEIALARPASLRGVVRIGRASAPAGVEVAALPSGTHPANWSDLRSSPSIALTRTDAFGQFEFALDPRQSYSLIAGGAGLVSSGYAPPVSPGAESVVLEVLYGYALAVRFADERGLPAQLAGGARTSGPFQARMRDPGVEPSDDPGSAAFLAGLPAELQSDLRDGGGVLLLYVSAEPHARVGPVDLSGWQVGYDPFESPLWAYPVGPEIREQTIALRQSAPGFGGLRLRFAGARPGDEVRSRSGPAYFLHLTDERGDQLAYPLLDWEGASATVQPIPAGTYLWSLAARPDPGRTPRPHLEQEVQIEVGAVAELEVALPGGCSLDIVVRRPSGELYAGPISAILSRPGSPAPDVVAATSERVVLGGEFFKFRGPPYRLRGLRPGAYAVSGFFPRGLGEGELVLDAGGPAGEVELELAD